MPQSTRKARTRKEFESKAHWKGQKIKADHTKARHRAIEPAQTAASVREGSDKARLVIEIPFFGNWYCPHEHIPVNAHLNWFNDTGPTQCRTCKRWVEVVWKTYAEPWKLPAITINTSDYMNTSCTCRHPNCGYRIRNPNLGAQDCPGCLNPIIVLGF